MRLFGFSFLLDYISMFDSNNNSACGITKEGTRWLRWVMVEAAQTHVHKYDTSITRAYHRIAERRGRRVAVVAAARKLLLCCYSVLKNKREYHDQAY